MLYPAELPGQPAPGAVWTKAPRAGKSVSMIFRRAHRLSRRFAPLSCKRRGARRAGRRRARRGGLRSPPAARRTAASGSRRSTTGSISSSPTAGPCGSPGVAPPDPARSPDLAGEARRFLAARFVGRDAELERLAGGTDRWGRVLARRRDRRRPPTGRRLGRRGPARRRIRAGRAGLRGARLRAERLRAEDEARRAGLGVWTRSAARGRRRGGRRGPAAERRKVGRDRGNGAKGWLWPLPALS